MSRRLDGLLTILFALFVSGCGPKAPATSQTANGIPAGAPTEPSPGGTAHCASLAVKGEAALLGDRLRIPALVGMGDIPKAFDVMNAPEPASEETRLIRDNGGKFVVYVHETWQTDPGPKPITVKLQGRGDHTVGPSDVEFGKYLRAMHRIEDAKPFAVADGKLRVVAGRPPSYEADHEKALVLAALIVPPDGTIIAAEFYVSPEVADASCTTVAEQMLKGLTRGKRNLERGAGLRTLGPTGYAITVPEDSVVTHKTSHDFESFQIYRLRPLGLYPGHALILFDHYDGPTPEGKDTRKGTVLGQPVTYLGEVADRGGHLEADVGLKQPGFSFLHVQIVATREGRFLEDFTKIVESIARR